MISVIIPTYNNEIYICDAIESVLVQTYKDLEIIVVDDGSSDGTKEILSKYLDKIIYVYKENGGEASARNLGLALAKGEYVTFLDGDDLYKSDKVEKQIKAFLENPLVDVVYNDVDVVDSNLKYLYTLKSEGVYEDRDDFLCMTLVRQRIPAPASMMVKRKFEIKDVKFPEHYSNSADYEFTIKLAQKCTFKYLSESIYIYRRHSGNLTNSHLKQVKCEVDIIKNLGIDEIEKIVHNSNFSENEKEFIFSEIMMKIESWDIAKKTLLNLSEKYNEAYVYFYLGNCYYNSEDYNSALFNYKKAIDLDSQMAEGYNNLGCCYANLNDKNLAEHNFIKALQLKEEYMDAKINLNEMSSRINFKLTNRELRKVLTIY
ncbi:glycosyltransferase [Clostridium sp. FP2]|uniref:glycosyltransferase n=1 Tax=Clostridium sp. FP2 TaxID=2724481 RepID=UPI0013E98B4C|nr:glycosyltransferase [Clostridium sp. FP2]MBZ9624559.1 glycosyltransferase [Clostridium sp. FP2]